MLPALVLLALLTLALFAPVLSARWGRNTGYPLAAAFAGGAMAFGWQGPGILAGDRVEVTLPWVPQLGLRLSFALDGLSLLFALLVLGVGALVMSYCARYFPEDSSHGRTFGLLTAFAASMLGLVLAGDVLLLFVFWELTSICSFFLIGGGGQHAAKPATRAFLVTGAGGLALFAAVILITVAAGTSDLHTILADPARVTGSGYALAIGTLLVLAAFTKSAQLPFHFWLPGAMVAATPISAYLHAATMVKAGIYLLMRFSPVFAGSPVWSDTLIGVGLATAMYGAGVALKQHDLKALLAYSTVSQLGWLVALVGVGTPAALAAGALHTVSHALFKASLFMLVGVIDKEAGSRDIRELSGLRRVMPVTAGVTGLAGLSMAGVPPLVGFVSKEESFSAFLAVSPSWLGSVCGALALTAAVLTFSYGWRIFAGAFAGPVRQPALYEPAAAFLAPGAVAAVAGLVLGLAVGALDPLLDRVVQDTLLRPGNPQLALWHGINPALGLSAATMGIGSGLFLIRDRVDRYLQSVALRWSGPDLFDRAHAWLLRSGARVAQPGGTSSITAHLAVPVVAVAGAAGGLVTVAWHQRSWEAVPEATQPVDWLVAAVLAAAVLALMTAGSRLAAVALLGVVGFVLAVWYLLLGAPDLALTQLLVETLTVVIAVLVLRLLPSRFPAASAGRRLLVGGLSLATGGAAAAGTYLMAGRREISPVGEYYLRESVPETGGTNAVNTILVDFRGLDTLGEITVLGVVGLGLGVLLHARTAEAAAGDLVVRTAERALAPVILIFAGYLLLRGHNEPGGGFIGGLVAGAAATLYVFARGSERLARLPAREETFVGTGLILAVGVGVSGWVPHGSFLASVPGPQVSVPIVGKLGLSGALVFDLGVFLVVLGLVLSALRNFEGAPGAAVREAEPR